jgi:hypothetical protein
MFPCNAGNRIAVSTNMLKQCCQLAKTWYPTKPLAKA